MLKIAFVVLVSFFAVIGVIECVLCILEAIALNGYSQPSYVQLSVALTGKIDNVDFFISTLLLQADKINFKNCVAKIVIIDYGLERNTYLKIKDFCDSNANISVEKN